MSRSTQERPLERKVAIVTGGSRGIGDAIAKRLGADAASSVVKELDRVIDITISTYSARYTRTFHVAKFAVRERWGRWLADLNQSGARRRLRRYMRPQKSKILPASSTSRQSLCVRSR